MFNKLLIILCGIFFCNMAVASSNIKTSSELSLSTSSIYDFLERDESWFSIKDITEKKNINSVTIYFQGKIDNNVTQSQVDDINALLTTKMQESGLLVRDCLECNKTRLHLTKTSIKYQRGLESNKELRLLGKEIQSDAFLMWRMGLSDSSQNITLSLVQAENNETIWADGYLMTKKEEEIKKELNPHQFGFAMSYIDLSGDAKVNGESHGTFSNVTDFSLRYYTRHLPSERLHFAVIANYFQNTDRNNLFNVEGGGIEGRVLYTLTPSWPSPSLYIGAGSQFVEGKNSFAMRSGVEFAYMKNGFFDIGVAYIEKNTYKNMHQGDVVTGKFGGAAVDFTIGFRF
ncbi:hypothetical protein GNP44_00780 [Aliivibrio fischeri]|uniref:hypothetical protein n=1 Tax=Aliivibrio fischeri TaxID=668 RepID=UPI0012D8B831|nr:hypothetical protein [Aliivibrio fischeri]MUK28633.1 hypothetical protein [Aliivibrio fischeri]